MTDAQIRTLISHAKSPGTGPWTMGVSLTLGRLQTKEEKSTINGLSVPLGKGKGGGGGGLDWPRPGQRLDMKGMHGD